MVVQYWWLRHGNFRPGKWNLPHMGDVIVEYRSKRYPSQLAFAIAANVDKQTVTYWENAMYLNDPERRIFLARMLKIPPALLGLTWQQVVYQDNSGNSTDPLNRFAELVEEEGYYHYEDTLVMAWGWFFSGHVMEIADRFERRMRKLEEKVRYAPAYEQEAWKELLCQYSFFASHIARHRGQDSENRRLALRMNAQGLQLAREIEDPELTAMLLCNRSDIQFEQEHYAQARAMARASIGYVQKLRVNTPLYGDIFLRSANIFAPYTVDDDTLAHEVRGWLDKAVNIVWKGSVEPDKTFLKLNRASVHHERAKVFLQFHQLHPDRGYLEDAQDEMKLAWEAFTPDLTEWKVFFHLTDARLFQAEKDLQRSAQAGLAALRLLRDWQSKKSEPQIRGLYYDLIKHDAGNAYVHALGADLGIFP